jgi:NitT/TauT family transport system permease protein
MANETATFESGSSEDAPVTAIVDLESVSTAPSTTATPEPAADAGPNSFATLEAGLDALDTAAAKTRRPWWRVLVSKVLPPVVALAVVVAIWDLLVALHLHSGQIMMPGPGDVWDAVTTNWGPSRIGPAIWDSVYRAAIGFAASVVIGTVIGLLVARIAPLRSAVQPLLSGLQNLPSVAWVPIGIIWFGDTSATIYTVVLLGAVPSIAVGLIDGLDRVPPIYLRVGRNLGARGLDSVRFVLIPAALPGYVSGMKQGWAFAWRSLMAAELIAISPELGPGVGQVMKFAQDNLDLPLAIGSIIIILIIGIGINQVFFAPLERRLLRTRGLSRS